MRENIRSAIFELTVTVTVVLKGEWDPLNSSQSHYTNWIGIVDRDEMIAVFIFTLKMNGWDTWKVGSKMQNCSC